jgi:hypothetical protein
MLRPKAEPRIFLKTARQQPDQAFSFQLRAPVARRELFPQRLIRQLSGFVLS